MRAKSFFTIDVLLLTLLLVSQPLVQRPCSDWKERGFATAYMVASKLTDPICSAHQLYRQSLIVDALYPEATVIEKWLRKGACLLGSSVYSFFALLTTLPGIELRYITYTLQNKPYLYFAGKAAEKSLESSSLSMLSWNLCCVSAGFSITDGGVLPWDYRIDSINQAIQSQDADVVCLYEIFDIQAALRLFDHLQHTYAHFYFHIGPNPIGLSSGLFIASKVQVSDPLFTFFPPEAFDGRGKHCNKGFFSFDIQQDRKKTVRIFTTHLQHSEIPERPTQGEVTARSHQMRLIIEQMKKAEGVTCVLTGDLNLEEQEYEASDWKEYLDEGKIEGIGCTWGGDLFCSSLVDKPSSSPLNLDHSLLMRGTRAMITTSYVDTGFDGATFIPEALSDHKGLLSTITFGH